MCARVRDISFFYQLTNHRFRGPPRGNRDGVFRHILGRENGNWMKKVEWLREWSIWYPAWLGKLGVNMNFRQFVGVIFAKNLRENGISSPPWEAPFRDPWWGHGSSIPREKQVNSRIPQKLLVLSIPYPIHFFFYKQLHFASRARSCLIITTFFTLKVR